MSGPAIVRVTSGALRQSTAIQQLVHEIRLQSDAFVFLSGGAAGMAQPVRRRARALLDALPVLVTRGLRIAVGDGGTGAGLMKEAGLARRRGGNTFPLIGVAPAPEITAASPWGVDPNHSHLVAVDRPEWTPIAGDRDRGFWGSETDAMFELFDRLAFERASVALLINGGAIALQEVARHGASGRRIVVVTGSGRGADAIAGRVQGIEKPVGDSEELDDLVRTLDLLRYRRLYDLFPLAGDAEALADVLERHLRAGGPGTTS
jgi:hypothetical protein